MRGVIGFAAMVIFAAAASAQGGMSGMSGMTAPTPAPLPSGWHLRTDSPKESPDAISFGATASGMHVTAGPSHAIYWSDANNATGTFTISGTFTQTKAPAMGHPEVRAGTDSVRFFANGKAVAAYDSGVATPGIYGFRVGHALDIVVEGFTKK